jgi:signal transduction histidine kinase
MDNYLSTQNNDIDDIFSVGNNDEETEKTLTLLDRSTDSAISMITNIRNALITKSQLELTQISHFSIERSINKLLLEFESRLAQKSLVLKIENKLQDEGMAKGNEEAIIHHVFANILSNAIKFSQPHSTIVITIDGNQDYILTSFKDTGIGFMKTKAKIHQPQLGTSGEKGSGFGLMIMGYFVRQFGGDFSIESEKHGESHGTTVTIKLLKAKATLVKTFDFSNKDANFLSKIL